MQIFFLFASNSRFRCLSIIFVPCFFFFLSLFWFLLKTVSMLDPRQTLFLSFFFCESVQYFFLLLLSAKHWFMLQTLNSWNIRRRMNVDCGKLEFFFQRQEVDAGQVWPGQVVCMCAGHFISTILCINELTNYRLPRKWTLISVWYSELQNKKISSYIQVWGQQNVFSSKHASLLLRCGLRSQNIIFPIILVSGEN